MPPKPRYNPEVIGRELIQHRDFSDPPKPWKTLEEIYGLGRARLAQLYQQAKARDHNDVYRHPDSGQGRRALG